MRTVMNPVGEPAHESFVEKKSEFIGDAAHVSNLEEALAFVESVREQHPKARHVAFAAICTDAQGNPRERMSDDGEPSGTAGKPILDVLRANNLTDTVIAVTRYFGGILLGSGGLIRAYSTGASNAVKVARVAEIVPCWRYSVRLQYPQLATFQQLLAQVEGEQESAEFTEVVDCVAVVSHARAEEFEQRVREQYNAAVVPERGEQVNRALAER